MSVATASAVLRLRLTRTISRALPRLTAAIAQAQPTLPVPIIPIFMAASIAGNQPAGDRGVPDRWPASSWLYPNKCRRAVKFRLFSPPFALDAGRANGSLPCHAGRLEQEPGAPLGLVDPVLDQAGAGHVVVLVANRVGPAQARRQPLVVVAQLREHVEGGDEVCVVVQHALQAADVADRAQRGAADFAHALGDGVGGRENLLALLVEEEMIVAEVRAGYVPMEILGLQVKRKHVGEHDIERAGDLRHGVGAQIGRRIERSDPQRGGILCCRHFVSPSDAMVGRWARRVTVRTQNHATAEKRSDRWRTSPSLGDSYMRSGATYRLIVLAPS